jgi:hypothetical protein
MYIVTAEARGHSRIIQNIIHPHNLPQLNLLPNILLRNLPFRKIRAADLMTSPVVEQRHQVKCRLPPATGQEEAQARVHGSVVAEPVVEEAVVAGAVVVAALAVAEEDNQDSVSISGFPLYTKGIFF